MSRVERTNIRRRPPGSLTMAGWMMPWVRPHSWEPGTWGRAVEPAGAAPNAAALKLPQPALAEESGFQLPDLLIEQIIRLVDEAQRDIRHHLARSRFYERAKLLEGHACVTAQLPHKLRLARFLAPDRCISHSQKILIVGQQLFQACPRHIGQLQLHLLGSARGFRSLNNILFSRTRRLHHLIDRAVALFQKPRAKPISEIIHDLRLLKRPQLAIISMRRQQPPWLS